MIDLISYYVILTIVIAPSILITSSAVIWILDAYIYSVSEGRNLKFISSSVIGKLVNYPTNYTKNFLNRRVGTASGVVYFIFLVIFLIIDFVLFFVAITLTLITNVSIIMPYHDLALVLTPTMSWCLTWIFPVIALHLLVKMVFKLSNRLTDLEDKQ